MNVFQYVAAQIREFRLQFGEQGISQDALAKELGVATNTISRWETGAYKPNIEDLDHLARFFGKSILDFFPSAPIPKDEKIAALLRAATDLPENDIEELRRYAEFRRARSLYRDAGKKPKHKTGIV